MPTENPLSHSFAPAMFMILMSAGTGAAIVTFSWLLSGRRHSRARDSIYECGLDPMDRPEKRFRVAFYVVAMLFILFDVEIAMMVPWAIFLGDSAATAPVRWFGLAEGAVFVGMLLVGYIYLYKAGAFDWAREAPLQLEEDGQANDPISERAA